MTIVDTCVLIDSLGGRPTPAVQNLRRLLRGTAPVGILGIIRYELLAGLRAGHDRDAVVYELEAFDYFDTSGVAFHDNAAARYAGARLGLFGSCTLTICMPTSRP